ncbi:hypothetical protein ELQ92_09860 [Labedella populi]|uniref:Type I restriction modification DNA specificity domain-containing protein n=1 Tax=Labedella populi TaxID=2498850 RepID=A0A444QB98_9MICO|nr:restriction endonuclease subunit S [Labedella populi]RWZ61303.1 hypothetical protein ELQ92_09860 [Labedella populi]
MSAYDDLTFAPMLITDVFETYRQAPAWLNTNQVLPGEPAFPHVTNSAAGNSVAGFISLQGERANNGNAITVGIDTQVVAYQPVAFYGATKVYELRSPHLDVFNGLVLTSVLRRAIEKFSWGHKASAGRLAKTRIMVPVTTDASGEQVVDWEGMNRLGEELMDRAITHAHSARTSDTADADAELPDLMFEPMFITDVFESMKASSAWFDKVHLKGGEPKVPYLSQTHSANSIAAIVADQAVDPEVGNCITVTLKTQATFYQPVPFYTAQNFLIFRHRKLNVHSGLMLTAIMRRAMRKFSWGYGVSMARLAKTRIMVPVTTDDSGSQVVDWEGLTLYGEILRTRAERAMSVAVA